MDQDIYKQVIEASRNNDIKKVKAGLTKLNIKKKFNPIKDIYYYFKKLQEDEIEKYWSNIGTHELMVTLLINATVNDDIDFCNYLIHSPELRVKSDLNDANMWIKLVETGNLNIIKPLLTVNANEHRAQMIASSIRYVRKNSKLEVLEYLIDDLTMPFHKQVNTILKEKSNYHTRIKDYELSNICQAFISACERNNKDFVDYLLQHKEYGKMIDNFTFFEGIKASCRPETFNLMDYLLTDKNMPFKSYVDYNPARLLQISARHSFDDILDYLVMDVNIKKPERLFEFFDTFVIAHHVVSFKDQDEIDNFNDRVFHLNKLFEKRDLNHELQSNLHTNQTNKLKRKL